MDLTQTHCGGIIRLSKVSVDATCRGGVDNTAVLLLHHIRICSLCTRVSASEVHADDVVPLLVSHIAERFVS